MILWNKGSLEFNSVIKDDNWIMDFSYKIKKTELRSMLV